MAAPPMAERTDSCSYLTEPTELYADFHCDCDTAPRWNRRHPLANHTERRGISFSNIAKNISDDELIVVIPAPSIAVIQGQVVLLVKSASVIRL